MRALVAAGLATLVCSCVSHEPSEADMLRALQRYHREWVAEQRRQAPAEPGHLVDLPFEAGLTLELRSVRKERCAPADDAMGYVCAIEVEASTPFVASIRRRMEVRFVEGSGGWLAVISRSSGRASRQ